MPDMYHGAHPGMNGPFIKGQAVTPSDGLDLPLTARSLWVGGLGDVTVILRNDDDAQPVTLKAVPAGTLLPMYARRVLQTGTTATYIIALQ